MARRRHRSHREPSYYAPARVEYREPGPADSCGTCGAPIVRAIRTLKFGRGRVELDVCERAPGHDLGRDTGAVRLTWDEAPEKPTRYDPRTGRRVPVPR